MAGAGFRLGTTGTSFEATEPASEHANAVALTANGTALYAAFETIDLDDLSYYNVVGKYAPNGRLLWQRESTVGTPYGTAVTSIGLYIIGKGGLARYSSGGDVLWTKTGYDLQCGCVRETHVCRHQLGVS